VGYTFDRAGRLEGGEQVVDAARGAEAEVLLNLRGLRGAAVEVEVALEKVEQLLLARRDRHGYRPSHKGFSAIYDPART
jgi:hypothetical protein